MAAIRFLLCLSSLAVVRGNVNIELTNADCHGDTHTYEDNAGHLLTSNYPANYPANCQWTVVISTLSGLAANLSFDGFSLGAGDSLQIYDYGSAYSQTWMKGDVMPTASITLSSSFAVVFKSDGFEESSGVKLRWVDNSPTTTLPTTTPGLRGDVSYFDVISGSPIYIQSTGYPDLSYQPNTIRHWVLTAPAGQRMVFIFKYFKTQETADKLQIYSGEDLLTEELIGDYSGNLNYELPPPLITPTHWVHVKFTSDNWLNHRGFNVMCQVYEAPTTLSETTEAVKKKLTFTEIFAIVIPLLLCTIVVAAILVYCFWYKPKSGQEIGEQTSLYTNSNGEYVEEGGVVMRVATAKPRPARPMTAGRPGTAARPKSAARPGSARPRPGSAARHRPETGHLRVPADRPGTAKRTYQQGGKQVPLAALVGSRQTTVIRDPTIHPPAKKVYPPQILVNDGYEDDDIVYQKEGKLSRGPSRLPPLGSQLPPLTGSTLPPITSANNPVPKLDLSQQSPRASTPQVKNEKSDGW